MATPEIRFHRRYRITFTTPDRENNYIIPFSIVDPKLIDRGTTPSGFPLDNGDYYAYNEVKVGRTAEITDEYGSGLQFRMTIPQTKEISTPVVAEFLNLDEDIIGKFRKDSVIIVRAGYAQTDGLEINAVGIGEGREDLPTLLVAQIAQISTEWLNNDRVTKIVCGEAITVTKNAKVSKSYPPNTTRREVLEDLLAILRTTGVPTGRVDLGSDAITAKIADKPLYGGWYAYGGLMQEIQRVCDDMYLHFYTVLGRVYVESKLATPKSLIFTVRPENVLGFPQPIDDNLTTSSNTGNKARRSGLQFKTWLEGNISVDKGVVMQGFADEGFEGVDGNYIVKDVVHDLDFRSKSNWITTVTVEPLE